jgi:hypothetical protein
MNSAAPTKIFGIRLGLDPKILVGLLIGVAAILFWYNSRGDETNGPATAARPGGTPAVPTAAKRATPAGTAATRRGARASDRETLRLQPIDATHGDVDPTLRLDLLARLQSVEQGENGRNLFQMGAAPLTDAQGRPIAHPIIPVKQLVLPPATPTPAIADVNIPLKYYGFAKPVDKAENNRGFFLDGDNILIASEGEVVKSRYLVVELTPRSARLEDTQVKKGKALPLEPEAKDQSNPAAAAAAAAGAGFDQQ